MKIDISKLCADFLRTSYTSQADTKLKASHAREFVAAFFGYKSHAALKAEKTYPLDGLKEAGVLIPDIPLLDQRRKCLKELPNDLFSSQELASLVSSFLSEEGYFSGDVWLYDTLETYITEILLIENDSLVSDELSGVMAETNAEFGQYPYYDDAQITDAGDSLVAIVSGKIEGTSMEHKPYSGDTIEFEARVTLPRVAGKRGFLGFDIEAGGSVDEEWRDTETHHEIPNVRPKEQFIQMTGGFKLGESQEQFESRQTEIHAIRNRIAKAKAGVKDIDRLSHLLGTDNDDDPFDDSLFR